MHDVFVSSIVGGGQYPYRWWSCSPISLARTSSANALIQAALVTGVSERRKARTYVPTINFWMISVTVFPFFKSSDLEFVWTQADLFGHHSGGSSLSGTD